MEDNFIENVKKGHRFLAESDPVMDRIIGEVGEVIITPASDLYSCLVQNIICQLISTKAADTVWERLQLMADRRVKPEILLEFNQDEFRSVGIGKQKYGYISHVSEAFLAEPDKYHALRTAEDKEVLKTLTALKGIGKWTAQMLLIFGLGRLDVFAPDDLGLKNAMIKHYEWKYPPKRADLLRKAEDWAPYRSIASVLLWRSLGGGSSW